jgi:hypothetical protein
MILGVIPAKARIQNYQLATIFLDPGFHPRIKTFRGRLGDDFLRFHHY